MEKTEVSPVDDKLEKTNSVVAEKDPANPDDKVDYRTYSKVLGEAKIAKLENERLKKIALEAGELKEKLQQKEIEELEKTGKLQEALESLKTSLKQKDETIREKENRILQSMVSNSIKTIAMKHGCVNPDKLLRLLGKDDIAQIDIDTESYNVNEASIEALIQKAKQDHDDIGLFKKNAPTIKDGTPTNSNPGLVDWREQYNKNGFKEAFKVIKSK